MGKTVVVIIIESPRLDQRYARVLGKRRLGHIVLYIAIIIGEVLGGLRITVAIGIGSRGSRLVGYFSIVHIGLGDRIGRRKGTAVHSTRGQAGQWAARYTYQGIGDRDIGQRYLSRIGDRERVIDRLASLGKAIAVRIVEGPRLDQRDARVLGKRGLGHIVLGVTAAAR
ncbi:hypothetical protein FVB9532_03894 [Mesonia oceanica]|uniref:Uncharacterized protein n=1 Tax=Mesonia oceanica TaxID=2687242 RepID=A0AC61YDI8_9FLAO|nr:hypothetical protein FVB9532_03894 [Mesonia oceanica]